MSDPLIAGSKQVIVVADLFEKINSQRKLLTKPPVENQAMATRLTLRFNVDKKRGVDFSAEKILIAPDEINILEKIINELFGIYFEDVVSRLCMAPVVTAPIPVDPEPVIPATSPELAHKSEKTGMLSKLKGLFGGK
jgi:hypothetical protein